MSYMKDNPIYGIAQKLNDSLVIKSDLNQAAMLLTDFFKKKYLRELNEAILEKHEYSKAHPSKEIILLQASKPFLAKELQQRLDDLTDMITTLETFKNIGSEFLPPGASSEPTQITGEDLSIHSDGIYEVDSACLRNKKTASNGIAVMCLASMLTPLLRKREHL